MKLACLICRMVNAYADLVGHAGRIAFLAFHPDGQRLASAGMDCDVRLWDPTNGRCMITLRGHRHTIQNGMAFSPDGSKLMTQDVLERVRIWEATVDERLRQDDLKKQADHYFELTDYDAAIDFYTQAIELDPDNANLFTERGRSHAHARHWALARADYESAISMGKDDVWTQFRPAFLSFMMGDYDSYRSKREQILERNHTNPRPDIAQETFRLCLLMQDDELMRDPRMIAIKTLAATKTNLPVWYQISQARYAYRTDSFDAWLQEQSKDSSVMQNAILQMIVAMNAARLNRTSESMSTLSDAILNAELSLQDSLNAGTYNNTWHGIVSTLAWLNEAEELVSD